MDESDGRNRVHITEGKVISLDNRHGPNAANFVATTCRKTGGPSACSMGGTLLGL